MHLIWQRDGGQLHAASRANSDAVAQRRYTSWFSIERVLWNTRSIELSSLLCWIYIICSQILDEIKLSRLPINESRRRSLRSRSVPCPPGSAIEIWTRFRWRKGFVSSANNFTCKNYNWRNAGIVTRSTFLNDILHPFSQMC